jgi:phage gpG-like protein
VAEYTVKITKVGIDRAQRLFAQAKDRMRDLSPPLKKARNVMLFSINSNFKAGGRPKTWRPLRPATLRRKISQGLNLTPLTGKTGRLQSSVTASVRGNRLAIGTSIVYGAAHQFGYPPRNLPKRPYLIFQQQDLDDIERLVVSYITGRSAY